MFTVSIVLGMLNLLAISPLLMPFRNTDRISRLGKSKLSLQFFAGLIMALTKNNLGIQRLTCDSYCSVISIVFGFEFDFEFVMAVFVVVGQKELHHFQEHKAFDHSTC
jgi:hypothetical protein